MQYRNPTPTVDVIVHHNDQILLIERKNEPVGWALPGGFVDEGEMVETAAIREVKEETNIDIELEHLLYVYSSPDRDIRQHNLSVVFTAHSTQDPTAGDDANKAVFFSVKDLPTPIVFDHIEIIEDFLHFQETGKRPLPMKKYDRHQ